MAQERWPESGDLVVCTVKNVVDFGAFVALDEYPDKEGLIHISEVASGWVKYIRDHVREGQKIVTKVLNVDPNRGHIDLSLKDVNEHQRREKIQEWKNNQKAKRWLQFVAEELKLKEQTVEEIEKQLIDTYDAVYYAFEEAAIQGSEAIEKAGISKKIAKKIADVASENVKIPYVDISGYVELTSPRPDGVEVIKGALNTALQSEDEDVKIDISYFGAPRYRIKVTAPDYKIAENVLRKAAKSAISFVQKRDGKGEFFRQIESKA